MTNDITRELVKFVQISGESAMFLDFFMRSLIDELSLIKLEEKSETTRELIEHWKVFNLAKEFDADACSKHMLRWSYGINICKTVDAFQYYISQILKGLIVLQPKLLLNPDGKDNEDRKNTDYKVDLREVLEAGTINEFVQEYADKKITDLGYAGLPKIINYLNSKLHLKINTTMPEYDIACEYIEARNLIVHNAGCVSRLYLRRSKRTDLLVGEPYPYDDNVFFLPGERSLKAIAEEIDSQIVSKFKLNDIHIKR